MFLFLQYYFTSFMYGALLLKNKCFLKPWANDYITFSTAYHSDWFCMFSDMSNMKMSNSPAKYEVLIKQYLPSILAISGMLG